MNINEILGLERVHGGGARPAEGAPADPHAFRKVLQELQSLGAPTRAATPARVDGGDCSGDCGDGETGEITDFADAMSRAEDEFRVMMELRHKLEQAFRSQHQP